MLALTARQQQILDLIKKAIKNTGFPPTRAEIAAELGFRSPNAAEEHLQALARKGAIVIAAGASRGIRLTDSNIHHSALLELKLIGGVAAGSPVFAQEQLQTSYQVDLTLFSSTPDYLLKVRGMSMRDVGILDGDLLAVKKTTSVKNGQIIIARLGDEVTVKRYQKQGSLIQLLPENPDFAPILISPDQDDFTLEGIVVGLLRKAI